MRLPTRAGRAGRHRLPVPLGERRRQRAHLPVILSGVTLPGVARYIFEAGRITIRTPGGAVDQPLWIGVEVDGPVPLEYLSRRGYDLIPADTLSADELRSVGVEHFEKIVAEPSTGV